MTANQRIRRQAMAAVVVLTIGMVLACMAVLSLHRSTALLTPTLSNAASIVYQRGSTPLRTHFSRHDSRHQMRVQGTLLSVTVQPGDPPHLETIKDLIDALLAKGSNADNNYFNGNPKNFSNDPLNPYVHASCSSFVVLVIKDTYPWMDDAWFESHTQSSRPNSAKLHDAVLLEQVFERITHVSDIKPGDLLVIKYLDGLSSHSGHAMVAAAAPVEISEPDPETVQPETVQYSVEVVDESSSYHTKEDTRYLHPGSFGTEGVGWGHFRIYAQLDGTVAGYSWSTSKYSSFYPPDQRDLVVGRLNTTAPAAETVLDPTSHLTKARDLITELQETAENSCDVPDGETQGVKWDAPAAAFGVCGSRFVNALLKETYGWTDAQFSEWWGSTRPSSSRWLDNILAEQRLSRVEQLADIKPGDIIAYKCVACSSSHSMIASSAPTPIANPAPESMLQGTSQFALDVVDACSSRHGSADTRADNPGGVGEGTIRLYAGGDGGIAAYSWSTYKSSTIYQQSERAIAVGRLPVSE